MSRVILPALILILATVACSFTSGSDVQPTQPPTAYVIITATSAPATATTQAQPSATPTRQTSSGSTNNVSNPTCTPRTDWVQYTVVSGDTLGTLAQRTSSTVAALSQGNCLSNADVIRVGQVLRLPKAPVVIPTVTTAPRDGGNILVNGIYRFEHTFEGPAPLLNLTWENAPRNAGQIEFWMTYPHGNPQVIATDYTPGDGATATWYPPMDVRVNVYAMAFNASNSVISTSNTIQVLAYNPQPVYVETGSIIISRYVLVDGGSHQLPAGETINLSWAEFPRDTARVDFIIMSNDGSTSVIATDNNPSDGAMISWNVPVNLNGSVKAIAFNRSSVAIGNSYPSLVHSQTGFVPN